MPMKPVGWPSSALPDKSGHRWYLWAFQSAAVVVFVLDPVRAPRMCPKNIWGPPPRAILSNVDRHRCRLQSTAASEERSHPCWRFRARRTSVADFLGSAAAWPTEQEWAFGCG